MQGKVIRVTSITHEIEVTPMENGKEADVKLSQKEKESPAKDFVLLILDESIDSPTLVCQEKDGETAVLLDFKPDLRPPKIKGKFFTKDGKIDKNPQNNYLIYNNEDTSEELVEPKMLEYIFVIDRSGSMGGDRIRLARETL